MGERSRSHSLGFGSICRACKSIVSRRHHGKNPSFSKKPENKNNSKQFQEDMKSPKDRYSEEEILRQMLDSRLNNQFSPRSPFKHRSCDDSMTRSPQTSPPMSRSTSPSPLARNASHNRPTLSRNTSRRSQTTVPTGVSSLLRSMSRTKSMDSASGPLPRSFSRNASRKGPTIIMYSNSNGLVKPPPMEEQLDCTLEELCFGSIKKVKITRDAVTDDGQILEEEEVLTIKVKPGWKKGTKITFEGMGNETPGTDPADVIFTIGEKEHPLFRREGDDLELGVEIPLIEALTGCSISVPLLGGQAMSLTVDDIIYPGYQKIIAGQGMPKQNEPETRANLIITFLVEFPEELSEEQRSDVVNILQDTCY